VKNTSSSEWLLASAGLGTWLVAGLPVLAEIAVQPAHLGEARYGLWLAAFTGFGVAFWTVSRGGAGTEGRFRALVAAQVLATLTCIILVPNGISSVLFVIVASQYAWLGSLRVALGLIALQTLVATVLQTVSIGWSPVEAVFQAGIYLGFQTFALFSSHTALKEAAARERLAQVNAELRATQELLSESSRISERLRIARELHDLIGHHLTALSLNLEVASHLLEGTEGKALDHVRTSQVLAKGLLADVREVVSTVREGSGLDLAGALLTLTRDIPTPKVHLQVPDDLGIDDPQRAQVVLRCAQEAITNAVKHAGAQNLWLTLHRTEGGIRLEVKDDGRGATNLRRGHGLTGMRERLESLGGRLSVTSAPGQGFSLQAELPA